LDEAAQEKWMNAPVEDALLLRTASPEGSVRVVATGIKQDRGPASDWRKNSFNTAHPVLGAACRA
jgi:hypothetical protein